MAEIEIKSAFVEKWNRNGDAHPGWGMKTSEPHRRKNQAGEWETVGRTFRTVKVARDSGLDLTGFRKGDRVRLTGREVTEVREHEGKKFYDLVVWADRVELESQSSNRDSAPAPSGDVWNQPQGGGEYGDDTPF